MSNVMFYSHSKDDLKRAVKMIIDEIRKTEIIDEKPDLAKDRLSQREAASFLGISVTSIISWKKQNKLPFFRIGNAVFYSKSDLTKLANKNQHLVKQAKK